jgi:hypothetical protein
MACFRDEDLVQYALRQAEPELQRQIEAHLRDEACRACGAFVEWLESTLPELRHAVGLAPAELIASAIERALPLPMPETLDVELAREIASIPVGVRNIGTDAERVFEVGSHRLELLVQPSLAAPFLDLVGLLEPAPAAGVEVALLDGGLPVEVQTLDRDGRFRFARLVRGVYEIEVRLPGEPARRTPPFDVRLG